MNDPWIALVGTAAIALVYVLLPVMGEVFARFRAVRQLPCPETAADAEVAVDARHAALTAAVGRPVLRVRRCSFWPGRLGCAQDCLGRMREAA